MKPVYPELIAPKGKYRIVGIDKFEVPGEGHWVVGDFGNLEMALALARRMTREDMPFASDPSIATVYYVYDDRGNYRGGDIYAGE